MGRRDIGRVLESSSGSPDLRIGMTSANFHTCVNLFEENEVLTRFVISAIVIDKLSFNTRAVTLSRAGSQTVKTVRILGSSRLLFPTLVEIQIEDTCHMQTAVHRSLYGFII